jgi:surface carbohydrate biosynthesis protein
MDIDVVLFDERGSEWLAQCIPRDAKTLVVPTKISVRDLYRLPFLLSVLKWVFFGRYGKLGIQGRLVCAYFLALIEKINPIVVISNNDGSEIIRAIGLNHKKIFVAVVQLALRERYQNVKIATLPTYFSFGKAQEKLFSASGITCDDVRPVGSLRNSIYRNNSQIHPVETEENPSLVFISQWKRGLCLNPTTSLFRAWNEGHRKTFQAIYRYANIHSIKLNVILRNTFDHADNMEQQQKYFIEAVRSSEINFLSSKNNELASYPPAYSGEIAVHFLSTLGFEVFGHGRKVLCCIGLGGGQEFIEKFGIQELIEELPQEVVLLENDENRVGQMISDLRSLPLENYETLTRKARNYYMSVEEVEKTHERIQQDISNTLKSRAVS